MSFIDRAENEVRVLNVVPCITAILTPKFPEEETYTPAQSELERAQRTIKKPSFRRRKLAL